jgi:hypothetical protein
MRNSKTRKSPALRPNEVEMEMVGQRGSVVLRHPEDLDLFVEIGAGRLTIARAIKRVALRRQLERATAEIERRERESWS